MSTLAAAFLALAVAPLRAELPSEAQVAIKKGVIAAQQQDYVLACRFFQDARKLAPDAPEVFYNLGLAESKIPGRELRAMAWFGAYLAAHPGAPNAAAVKEQIDVLDVKNQSNFSRLMKVVQDALPKFRIHPLGRELPDLPADNSFKLLCVAELWAHAGDIAAALKTADLIEDAMSKRAAQRIVASVQAQSGDIAGAQKTTQLIHHMKVRGEAQRDIAAAQAESGDIADAQKSADLIQDPDDKGSALAAIAKAKAEAGVTAGVGKVSVYDWIAKLDDDRVSRCPLSAAPFLDLASYLKSLPISSDSEEIYEALFKTARTIVRAQNVIAKMLKQQAKQQATP